ncbi:hypothetical protein BDZ97DRAFT_1756038 [Flammula alnicola]|nr:hypothetical protein BDZ97DRAFT_1756038 [Flammula alnicola]
MSSCEHLISTICASYSGTGPNPRSSFSSALHMQFAKKAPSARDIRPSGSLIGPPSPNTGNIVDQVVRSFANPDSVLEVGEEHQMHLILTNALVARHGMRGPKMRRARTFNHGHGEIQVMMTLLPAAQWPEAIDTDSTNKGVMSHLGSLISIPSIDPSKPMPESRPRYTAGSKLRRFRRRKSPADENINATKPDADVDAYVATDSEDDTTLVSDSGDLNHGEVERNWLKENKKEHEQPPIMLTRKILDYIPGFSDDEDEDADDGIHTGTGSSNTPRTISRAASTNSEGSPLQYWGLRRSRYSPEIDHLSSENRTIVQDTPLDPPPWHRTKENMLVFEEDVSDPSHCQGE